MSDLPEYYFRLRENGAQVFALDTENRERRIAMRQIAVANVRNDEIRPHGGHDLTPQDRAEIERWMAERKTLLAQREMDDVQRSIEHLNQTAQWAQSKATDAQLDEVTGALLMAMHDLRSVLVRKKSDRLSDRKSRN